jgi:galactose mutarotase-like enzyme
MLTIENSRLKVGIKSKGAELTSVFHKQHQLEYMWEANPDFWAKSSPVLFPIVGQLKENTYRYKGQSYHLPRHGFAREKEFDVTNRQPDSVTFLLQSSEETLAVYPFSFRFSIIYTLHEDELSVTYNIENRGEEAMLFSVGGHPAFRMPLVEGTSYNDYRLVFDQEERAGRWPISKDGTIETNPEPLLRGTKELPLTKELFANDAVVLKHLQSEEVQLLSGKTEHGLRFSFAGFPYLGLWAAPGADFVCIEPWCGIADSVNADGQLQNKEGINRLSPGEAFAVAWIVRFF